MPKRGTRTRKRSAKSKDSSDGRSGARASSRSKLEATDAAAAPNPKERRILAQRLAALAPAAPMAHERAKAERLLNSAPATPPARVKRAASPKDAHA